MTKPTTAPEGKSLIESIDQLEDAGFTGQFVPNEDGLIKCTSCQEAFEPSRLDVTERIRMEGASDPDEMAIVLGGACPLCDQLGTLTLSYGPLASDEDIAVMEELPDLDDWLRSPGIDLRD